MTTKIQDHYKDLCARAPLELTPAAAVLAMSNLNKVVKFLTDLLAWMDQTFFDLSRVTNSPKENWKYVSTCVRAIFEYLHDARRVGIGGGKPSKETILWGCLHGAEASEEFQSGFTNHSCVQNQLNLHMQHNAVCARNLKLPQTSWNLI